MFSSDQAAVTTPVSVALDSGTSLIAAPAADVAAIFSKVPDAKPSEEPQFQGYWEFGCDTQVNVSFTFAGVSYPIKFVAQRERMNAERE